MKEFDLNNYLFGYTKDTLSAEEQKEITEQLKIEMDEIYYGMNMDAGSIGEEAEEEFVYQRAPESN